MLKTSPSVSYVSWIAKLRQLTLRFASQRLHNTVEDVHVVYVVDCTFLHQKAAVSARVRIFLACF